MKFTINEQKYEMILELSEHEQEQIDKILFYDWANDEDHQEWLDEGTSLEIVDWLDELVDYEVSIL